MHDWSSRKENLILITGHTHKPVFASGRYSDHKNNKVEDDVVSGRQKNIKPSYFNSGCCCYNDGDITGIEICGGKIHLIKWHLENSISQRSVLEKIDLSTLKGDLG